MRLKVDGLSYESQKIHTRKIAGQTVHLISRSAYRKLIRGRFVAKLSNWAIAIRRRVASIYRRRTVRKPRK